MGTGPRLARVLLKVSAVIVPEHRRSDWLEEWRAELWHQEHGAGRGRPVEPFVRTAVGIVRDAFAVRHATRRETGRRGVGLAEHDHIREGMMTTGREVRIAARTLLRSPGFSAIAVLTLGIGIGATAAIYSLLDRVVLNPLPYPESGRLVRLLNTVPCVGEGTVWQMATAQFVYYGDNSRTIESIGAYRETGANAVTPDGAERVRVSMVSASMMELLGARTVEGRSIGPDDDVPGAPNVALLSHGFWSTRYGADPGVVGDAVVLNDVSYEVIGVLQRGLDVPQRPGAAAGSGPDVWIPLRISRQGPFQNNHVIPMIARLTPAADAALATAELDGLTRALPEAFPQVYSVGFVEECGFRSYAVPLKEHVVGEVAQNLWLLLGAVGVVLLIACANVANLFLVRLDGRRRDLAVRRALGAGRLHVTGQLLTESLLVSIAGGVLGLLAAFWGLPALVATAPSDLPRLDEVAVSFGAVAFGLGLSVVVGVILPVLPSFGRHGSDLAALSEGARRATTSPGRQRLRRGLVVTQVALALALTTGASLIVQTTRNLRKIDPGFEPAGVLAIDLALSERRYRNDMEAWPLYREVLDEVRAIPGVTAAGMSDEVPVEGGFGCTVQGFPNPAVAERLEEIGLSTCAGQEQTTPGYFEAMGIPLLRGRLLERGDLDDPTRGVVVVSEAFAERFWGDEPAIGQQVGPSGTIDSLYTVVGVVGDVPTGTVDGPDAIAIYYPIVWIPGARVRWPGTMTLVVRSDLADPFALVPAIRRALASIDPSIPLANARTMEAVVDASMARVAFTSTLLRIAAGMALLLAAIGLYGVVSYTVSHRTREIGMRMAMGAGTGQVLRSIILGALGLAALGLALGAVLALLTGRLLESLLVGVRPMDPSTLLGAALILVAISGLASWVPAWRAARVDPATALRAD